MKFRKRADKHVVFIPGAGALRANQILEGEQWAKYCPALLEEVIEEEPEFSPEPPTKRESKRMPAGRPFQKKAKPPEPEAFELPEMPRVELPPPESEVDKTPETPPPPSSPLKDEDFYIPAPAPTPTPEPELEPEPEPPKPAPKKAPPKKATKKTTKSSSKASSAKMSKRAAVRRNKTKG